jgi:hypothetical protein
MHVRKATAAANALAVAIADPRRLERRHLVEDRQRGLHDR